MASALIHICVAKELNKYLKKKEKEFFLGSIAPDLGKQVKISKKITHFEESLPNIEEFLKKYQKKLEDPFVLGYYVHLYTDYLWFKYFLPEIINERSTANGDTREIACNEELFRKILYQNYTNLNTELIDHYKLDLSLFYEELPDLTEGEIVEEIPKEKLQLLVDEIGLIITQDEKTKEYLFDIESVIQFISTTTNLILTALGELKIYEVHESTE